MNEPLVLCKLSNNPFEKLTLVGSDLTPLFQKDSNAIAMAVYTDDYGNVSMSDYYPSIGCTQTITYVEDAYYIDSRTGEKCDATTPQEYLGQYRIMENMPKCDILSSWISK